MRSSTFTRVEAVVLLAFAIGCGAQDTKPAADDARATPSDKPAQVDKPPVAATVEPEGVPPVASPPTPGPGFTLGPAPTRNAELDGKLDPLPPIDDDGTKLLISAQQTTVDEQVSLVLRARVELPSVAAPDGFNHERAVELPEYGVERLELDSKPIAKLPDGRWVVDVMLIMMTGEDVIESSTEHSVILVDAAKPTAKLLWSGAESGTSEFGVCVSMTELGFAVVGDELVVSKSESVEWDAEAAKEMNMAAEDCTPKPKVTAEAARVPLAG